MTCLILKKELKKLPHVPGVYLMHDSGDHIIYVGKAIDLYNRVHQYFQTGYKKSPKIQKMVSHIAWFEYIVCGSEIEALVLECNLIKEHRPHYNTMLTDDKGYPYIRITVEEDYPHTVQPSDETGSLQIFRPIHQFQSGEGYHRAAEKAVSHQELQQGSAKGYGP